MYIKKTSNNAGYHLWKENTFKRKKKNYIKGIFKFPIFLNNICYIGVILLKNKIL